MPHSSGGGHGGGGFHSGGSFHSGHGNHSSFNSTRINTVRYSRVYFPGAYCYIYYDRHYRPHAFYSDSLKDKQRIPNWKVIIGYAVLLLAPMFRF